MENVIVFVALATIFHFSFYLKSFMSTVNIVAKTTQTVIKNLDMLVHDRSLEHMFNCYDITKQNFKPVIGTPGLE